MWVPKECQIIKVEVVQCERSQSKEEKIESPIINLKCGPREDPPMTNDTSDQLYQEDDELLIDEEQHSRDFQNENNIDHMKVEVVHMVDQIPDLLIQYIYTCSQNWSVVSEP